MRNKKPFIIFVLLIVMAAAAFADDYIAPFIMPSARAAGFGGIHTAQGDDLSALFSNPAGFVDVKKQFGAAEMTISLYGPVFELADLAANSGGNINLSPLVGAGGFAAGADIGGPIAVGYINKGFGIGLFNRTTVDARVTASKVKPVAAEEIFVTAGYSFRTLNLKSNYLDVGFLAKGFYRASMKFGPAGDGVSIINVADIIDGWEQFPAESQFGMGFDLGVKYSYGSVFSAAIAAYDAFSPTLVQKYDTLSDFGDKGHQSFARVTPRLAVGFLYRIKSDRINRYLDDWTLMLDYRDLLDLGIALIPRNPILNVSFGTEIKLLKVLSIRAGIADALPSLGFGLDLKALKLDLAIRGREMGLDPGILPVYEISLGFLFRY
jgi:hypothetical protein